MTDVKNIHYLQVNHKIEKIFSNEDVLILPSSEAWKKFSWTRKYFFKKPKQGYFLWVKKQINFPLFSCVLINSKKITQDIQNLAILEKGVNVSLFGSCSSLKSRLYGFHNAQGKFVLKKGASLKYEHRHSWNTDDKVKAKYEFILEENAKLNYIFKSVNVPGKMEIENKAELSDDASCEIKAVIDCKNSEMKINDIVELKGEQSSGQIHMRLVGREKSIIYANSEILAKAQSKGHLDCQGLLVDESSKISLIPKLICSNKKSQITHEASIGKISQEQLSYLRTRGLNEKEAISLIINGFLNI